MKVNLEELHSKYYELVSDFNSICKKHNLEYYVSYGTLIGQVLHRKIIPWDDDFDIIMDRDNYDKLTSIIDSNLVQDVKIHNSKTNKDWPFGFSKLTFDKYEVIYEDGYKGVFKNLWIDIAPLDKIDRSDDKQIKNLYRIVNYYKLLSKLTKETIKNEKNLIKKIIRKGLRIFFSKKRITRKINKLNKTLNGDQHVDATALTISSDFIFEKEDIFPIGISKMENIDVMIPANCEKVLDAHYPNWRVIPDEKYQINPHRVKSVKIVNIERGES